MTHLYFEKLCSFWWYESFLLWNVDKNRYLMFVQMCHFDQITVWNSQFFILLVREMLKSGVTKPAPLWSLFPENWILLMSCHHHSSFVWGCWPHTGVFVASSLVWHLEDQCLVSDPWCPVSTLLLMSSAFLGKLLNPYVPQLFHR